jgi:hypothetical protein
MDPCYMECAFRYILEHSFICLVASLFPASDQLIWWAQKFTVKMSADCVRWCELSHGLLCPVFLEYPSITPKTLCSFANQHEDGGSMRVQALDLSMLRSDLLYFEIDTSPFCASLLMMVPLSLDAKHNMVGVVRRRNVSQLISSLSYVFTLWSPSNHLQQFKIFLYVW